VVVNLEADWEKVGLMELVVLWQIEVGGWEKMGEQRRLREGTPKPHPWTSTLEPVAIVVACPF